MEKLHILAFFVFSILMISFVSAGLFDDLFSKITGKASAEDINITVTVSGDNAVVIVVNNDTIAGGTQNAPTEDSFTDITFFVNVSDADGVNDINDSSVNATFMFTNITNFPESATSRSNSSCILVEDVGDKDANYSCTIRMYYFDGDGLWNITVRADDLGGGGAQVNGTNNFTYTQLKAIQISPSAITFASAAPGATNETSNNDPTIVNNTGNFNMTAGGLEINGTDLVGVTNAAEFIPAGNFTVDIETGSNVECAPATAIVNASSTAIGSSHTGRGNNSLSYSNQTSGQEEVYYCLLEVPTDIGSQTYSAAKSDNGYGAWIILMS